MMAGKLRIRLQVCSGIVLGCGWWGRYKTSGMVGGQENASCSTEAQLLCLSQYILNLGMCKKLGEASVWAVSSVRELWRRKKDHAKATRLSPAL